MRAVEVGGGKVDLRWVRRSGAFVAFMVTLELIRLVSVWADRPP